MNSRLAELLALRAGEGRLAALVVGVMLSTAAGSALGGTGIEALFFARFGTEYLPYLYMALGATAYATSLLITALLGRMRREVLYRLIPLAIAAFLIAARLALTLNLGGLYPALWLGKEVLNNLIGLMSWGVAGAVCDTRQAKRLFPLFGAGRILGSVLGGLGTGPLVAVLRTENLLLVWAAAMGLAFVLVRMLLAGHGPSRAASPRRAKRPQPSLITETQRGWQFVRRSPLMQWISVAAILFSILFFSIALPFSKSATARFSDEQQLAGFLGAFNGLSTGAAFLASLFLANRLFARFGIMRAILAFPVIYLIGFGALAAYESFPVIVIFRFVQMLWLMGVAESAYQAMFNAVPAERRDQVRAFIGGVPEQAGTFIAGAILVIGEQALPSQQLYLVGLGAAALTTYVIWRAARAYGGALVQALRAGQPQLFFCEEEPFGGFQRDAAAVQVAVEGMSHTDPLVRRMAAEILGNLPVPQATDRLVAALSDADTQVRAASLNALARAEASPALLEVAACLRDPEPEVREQAVESLQSLARYPTGLAAHLQPLLADSDAGVRARAAAALLRNPSPLIPKEGFGVRDEARALLRSMAMLGEVDDRVQALGALGEVGDEEAFALVTTELADAQAPAAVRRAAASALGRGSAEGIEPLIAALADSDRSVREAAARALAEIGPAALERITAVLFHLASENGALFALECLSDGRAGAKRSVAVNRDPIWRYAAQSIQSALQDDAHQRALAGHSADARMQLLCDALRDRARQRGLNALRAFALLDERETYAVAIENLQGGDAAQRANALETLEAVRAAPKLRPLLRVWESPDSPAEAELPELHLLDALDDPDPWMRACAALAAGHAQDKQVRDTLARLAHADPDALVRETAVRSSDFRRAAEAATTNTGGSMDTLATLPVMERILLLRRVPLFATLSPADLKQVAAIANELAFSEGDLIAAQGEPGEEMFVIIAGEVDVHMDGHSIARRGAGDVVGEMAVISREPRMASMIATDGTRLLCIDRKSFEGLLRERPEAALAVMRVLCQRLKEAMK
jgi:HEAT repeat protein